MVENENFVAGIGTRIFVKIQVYNHRYAKTCRTDKISSGIYAPDPNLIFSKKAKELLVT
jgi:hypothetical protein